MFSRAYNNSFHPTVDAKPAAYYHNLCEDGGNYPRPRLKREYLPEDKELFNTQRAVECFEKYVKWQTANSRGDLKRKNTILENLKNAQFGHLDEFLQVLRCGKRQLTEDTVGGVVLAAWIDCHYNSLSTELTDCPKL